MQDGQVNARLLAEVLRLQRWAGGESVDAARIFGLAHGFESVMRQEADPGISETTQEAVEDILDAIEKGDVPAEASAIKTELRARKISAVNAAKVITLCRLQGRFEEAIDSIAKSAGKLFPGLRKLRQPECDWFGALHYMELCEATSSGSHKMHAVFSPTVPRVGETIEPERGSPMRVVAVRYVATTIDGGSRPILVPHVILRPVKE